MAKKKNVTDKPKATDVPLEYRECRTIQHAWRYTTVERAGRNYKQGLACSRCGTERHVYIDAKTGELRGASYKYAPGYLMSGGLGYTGRASLRLLTIQQQLENANNVTSIKQRKKA